MLDKKVRWGILGAGKIAHSFLKDFPLMKNAELVAIAARDKTRAEIFATQYHIPKAYDYNELYESTEVDAVYISTTHNFHFEQSLQCLQHGKSVLCEKPITVNDSEFKKLALLAKEKNLFLMEAMWTYFLPAIQKAKQWLDEGRIGELKIIQADFSFLAEKNMEGRMYNPALAGGALLDLGVYPVAFSSFFMNRKPDFITASAQMAKTGVDERTGIILQYGNVTATLFTSMIVRTANTGYLFGEKGYIEIPYFWRADTIKIFDADFQLIETYNDKRSAHGFIYEMQEANDQILKGAVESPVMPHSRSNEIQEILTEVRSIIGLKYPMEKA